MVRNERLLQPGVVICEEMKLAALQQKPEQAMGGPQLPVECGVPGLGGGQLCREKVWWPPAQLCSC